MFLIPYGRRNKGLTQRPQSVFDIDSMFDSFFNDSFTPAWFGGDTQMRVDIKDNDKEYIVEADMPGIKKEEINVELNDDRLTIAVEEMKKSTKRKKITSEKKESGSFCRSFYVENVKDDQISAKFENGVLSVVLPKKEAGISKKNKIEIE